ncbi:MAG: hypothetical protein H3C47_07670 [Candidatus Cloacimonetes bacterium]|nr:hypothetical protein [Candidatus Cloacimonadota bacterium]
MYHKILLVLALILTDSYAVNTQSSIKFSPRTFVYEIFVWGEFYALEQTSILGPNGLHGPILSMAEPGTVMKTSEPILQIAASAQEENMKREKRRLSQSVARLERSHTEARRDLLQIELQILEQQFEVLFRSKEIEYGSGEKDERVLKNYDLQRQLLTEKIRLNKDKLETYKNLSKLNTVSREDLDKVEKDLAQVELEFKKIIVDKQIVARGKQKLEIERLILEKEHLSRGLSKLKTQLEEKEELNKLQVEKDELVIRRREQDINRRNKILETATIVAPHSGTLVQVFDWMGPITVGTDAWANRNLAQLVSYDKIRARLLLPEKFIELAKNGIEARIRPKTHPHREIRGKVIRIESIARPLNPRDRKSVKVHSLHASLEDISDLIPSGNLEAILEMGKFPNVLVVPRFMGEEKNQMIRLNTTTGPRDFPLVFRTSEHYLLDSKGEEVTVHAAL